MKLLFILSLYFILNIKLELFPLNRIIEYYSVFQSYTKILFKSQNERKTTILKKLSVYCGFNGFLFRRFGLWRSEFGLSGMKIKAIIEFNYVINNQLVESQCNKPIILNWVFCWFVSNGIEQQIICFKFSFICTS